MVKHLEILNYSGVKWLQFGRFFLWQEDNFDMGETIIKKI